MPSSRRMCLLALLALLGFGIALLAGCGDNNGNSRKLLSHASASKLQSSLNDVEQKVSEGDCEGARSQAATLQQQVDGLPRRTNRKLRRALSASTSRLVSLVDGECRPATTVDTTPAVPPTTTETTPQEPPGQQKKDKTKPQDKGKGKQKGNEQGDGTQTTPDTGTNPSVETPPLNP